MTPRCAMDFESAPEMAQSLYAPRRMRLDVASLGYASGSGEPATPQNAILAGQTLQPVQVVLPEEKLARSTSSNPAVDRSPSPSPFEPEAVPSASFATDVRLDGSTRQKFFGPDVRCVGSTRENITKRRKPSRNRNPNQDVTKTSPVNWSLFLDLLEEASDSGLDEVESSLLEIVESIEAHFNDDTLEWWAGYGIMECISAKADPTWVKAAVKQLVQTNARDPPKPVRVVALNITTWGPKFKDWLSGQPYPFDILCVQETHLLKQVPSAGAWLSSRGLVGHFGPGHKSNKLGIKGGLVTISASHRNVSQSEGCGFLVDFLRLKGWTLAVINLYLQSATSLQATPNCTIVARLLTCVRELTVPWVVIGDFNTPLTELQATSIPTEAQGLLVSPGGATTDDGACLDYALACHSLAGCLVARISWEAPFRPHALVEFSLMAGCTLPLPQLPYFRQLKEAPSQPFVPCTSPRAIVWDGCPSPSAITCEYGAWSQAAAATFGFFEQGPGCGKGKPNPFWDRVSAWAKKHCAFKGRLADVNGKCRFLNFLKAASRARLGLRPRPSSKNVLAKNTLH